jgi:hypothetical protein
MSRSRAKKRVVDLVIEHHGTVVLLRPQTDDGRQWLEECEDTGGAWPWFGEGLACSALQVPRVLQGARSDGLAVVVELLM